MLTDAAPPKALSIEPMKAKELPRNTGLELFVNRSKPHICDFIHVFQLLHDDFTDIRGCDFGSKGIENLP